MNIFKIALLSVVVFVNYFWTMRPSFNYIYLLPQETEFLFLKPDKSQNDSKS